MTFDLREPIMHTPMMTSVSLTDKWSRLPGTIYRSHSAPYLTLASLPSIYPQRGVSLPSLRDVSLATPKEPEYPEPAVLLVLQGMGLRHAYSLGLSTDVQLLHDFPLSQS